MEKMQMGWRMGEARKAVKSGASVGFAAEKIAGGWLLKLVFNPVLNGEDGYLNDFRRDEPRVFSRADSVLSTAQSIGFDISEITAISSSAEVLS